jgi:hypothetical protein
MSRRTVQKIIKNYLRIGLAGPDVVGEDGVEGARAEAVQGLQVRVEGVGALQAHQARHGGVHQAAQRRQRQEPQVGQN